MLSKKDEIDWFFMQGLNSFKVGFGMNKRIPEFDGSKMKCSFSGGVSVQGDLRHLGIPYLFGKCCQLFGGINFREQGLWHMPSHTCTCTVKGHYSM